MHILKINSPSLGLIPADRLNTNRASFGIALGACANGGSAFLGAVLVDDHIRLTQRSLHFINFSGSCGV